jgi:hypothetical protein
MDLAKDCILSEPFMLLSIAPSSLWLKSMLAAQLIMILQVFMTSSKSLGLSPTFYF